MKKELTKIFRKYKRKYKLKTIITFKKDDCHTCYCMAKDRINIDLNWVKYELQDYFGKGTIYRTEPTGYETTNIKEITIFMLLHEIKHALDFSRNELKFLKDLMERKEDLQKRADRFAKREIKRWIKK